MHETVNQEQDKISILSAIVEVIASRDNIIDIFKEIREYLYSIIPCDYITVLFNNESARYFYIVPALNITKSIIKGEITIPYHETSITEILRSKATIKRDDLDERGNMTPGDLKFLLPGIRSDLSIPVITQNRVRAVINCSSYKSNVFTPVHQTLLEEIGLILSISLRRIDLEEEVRSLKTNINQWRTKYKTLLENSKQPIVVINSDLASIYEANKSFEVLTGYNSQQLNGMRFTELHPKIQAHILTKTVQDAVQGKTSQLNHIELLQNNGENIFVNLHFHALEQNEEPKLFAVYEQVAEQETDTRQQNSQIQPLIDVGNELLATNNLELISISLLDGLGINQNARYVTLHLYDNDQQKLNLYCARKFPFENGMSIMHPWLLGLKQGPYAEVLEQDRIFKCNNVFTDKQFHRWLPIAQKLGYSAMVSLPLIMPHRKLGVLTLFYEQAQDFSNETIISLKNISNYLALLLNDHNLNQQFKTTELRLAVIQRILNCVNSGFDLKETIQTTAIQIKKMIKYDHFSITVFDSNAENYHIYAVASETYNRLFEPESFAPIEQSDLGWLHVPIDQPEQNGKMTLFNSWFSKLKSRMDILLLVKNKYLGAITVGSLEPNIYSRQHEDFLKDISAHISFAIENSRLHAETRKKLDSFSILAELCDDVKNVTDPDELISTMLHFIGKAVNAPLSTFRFVEHEKAQHRVYCTMPDAEEKGLLKKEFREFAPRIISTNEPLRIEDFDSYQNNQFANLHFPEGYQAYLGMPVSYRNSITGILSVYWKSALKIDARLLDIVTTISLLCAVKIENIRLLDASSQNSDDLKSSNEELENFVYTVSHDLKSPIVSIQGFSSILLNDFDFVLNDESRHYLKRIQTNANQMEALVKDLLELSRIGRVVSPFEEADVREIISKSLDELIYQIEKRGIETNIPDKMPVIFCDKKRISQVFSNLIDNAIKYIGSQNQSPQIEIGCKDENDCHLFFVKDNGLGIPEEFHTQIFGLFRRLSQEDSEEFSTGVGLAIVHRIIKNHGGKIWFDSEPEKGSTFYFTIPKKVENK